MDQILSERPALPSHWIKTTSERALQGQQSEPVVGTGTSPAQS